MPGIEKAPYKGGFRRSLLKSCTRRFAAIVGIGFFAFTLGSLRAEFLYVANAGSNNVSVYRISPNGALTSVPGSPFTAGNSPRSVAVDLFGRFVYVANAGSDNVSAFRIAENGALTSVAGSPFPTGNAFYAFEFDPDSVAVDLLGRFVYVANGHQFNVSAFRIAGNGALTPVAGSPFGSTGIFPVSVTVDRSGHFVYVAVYAADILAAYGVGKDGALTPVPGSPFPTGFGGTGLASNSVAVDFLGQFLYVANSYSKNVSAYRIGPNGALTPVPGSPFPAGSFPNSVAVDLLGRFVYVVNTNNADPAFKGSVSAYSIGENGALTPVAGSPFPTAGTQPWAVAVDIFGRFVYVANIGSNNVSAYSIAENGSLTPVPGSPFPAGNSPGSVAFSP
jgi:6-phosphogluconolactonase (cycloisomerase 2 family)